MIQANYSELVKKISEQSGKSIEEVEKLVEEKKAKLSDLISKEGAAQIVASSLGVNFDRQKSKIDGLLVGMKKAAFTAQILKISQIRGFKTRTGTDSKVVNLTLADDTGLVRVVLWDLNQIKLIEDAKIKEGDFVEIKDSNVKQGMNGKEAHLGSYSGFQLSKEIIANVMTYEQNRATNQVVALKKKISELAENERVAVRAVVLQAFEPKFFSVCPECGKKPAMDGDRYTCATHGNVVPKERSLMNILIDDGSGYIRSVFFNDVISKLFNVSDEEIRALGVRKDEFVGKEMLFTGRVRKNKLYDNLEFSISSIEEVDPDKLIQELGSN